MVNKIQGNITSNKGGSEYHFVYEYYCDYRKAFKANTFVFSVWELGRENEDTYSFQLRIMEDGISLKVVDLFPDAKKYYIGKGISHAIIIKAKGMFGKKIISSSNLHPSFDGEKRWPGATRVWEKLVMAGTAAYDDNLDVFHTL